MRKAQDYYFRKAKQEKYPARSVFKLEEVQKRYNFLRRDDTVLDLGCRPGSWLLFAAKAVGPGGKVVGIDLEPLATPARGPGLAPIEVFRGDITSDEALSLIVASCPRLRVVLSDLAPRTTGNKWVDHQQSLVLARRALAIAGRVLAGGGNFFCKFFQGEDSPLFIEEVRQRFITTKEVKPKSSRAESREMFVLGLGFITEVRERCQGIQNGVR